jgi:hypothetical protein
MGQAIPGHFVRYWLLDYVVRVSQTLGPNSVTSVHMESGKLRSLSPEFTFPLITKGRWP